MLLGVIGRIFLLAIALLASRVHSSHILAVFINGHASHMLVHTAIVQVLLQQGHNITILTTQPLDSETFQNYLPAGQLKHWQFAAKYTQNDEPKPKSHSTDWQILSAIFERIEQTSGFLQDPLMQEFLSESQQFDLLLLGYLFNDYQLGLAAHFKCPVVLIWPGQPMGFINKLLANAEQRWHIPQPYDSQQNTGWSAAIFEIFENIIQFMTFRRMQAIYDLHFPSAAYPAFEQMRRNVSLVFLNHHSISEGPIAAYLPNMIDIGGIQNELPLKSLSSTEQLSSLLDKPLIYFSLGSQIKWSKLSNTTLNAFAAAFKSLNSHTVLWTYDGDCQYLTSLSANIKCAHWWPQKELLALNNLDLFITHGGKASVAEALLQGKPMLGLPLIRDQNTNIANVVRKGCGLEMQLQNITSQLVLSKLLELTSNLSYRRNAQKLSAIYKDRALTPRQSVIYWIEYVIRHRGAAHLQSDALNLNFWQHNSIDVLAFILVIFFTVIKLCNYLENKLLI